MQNQATLTDQDRMDDLLSQEKYLMNAYATFIPEASCPALRKVLTDNFNDCAVNQYAVFDQMSKLGWYPTKAASGADVDAARQKFQRLKGQLG